MRQDFLTLAGQSLLALVPETKEELEKGYGGDLKPAEGEAMVFPIWQFVSGMTNAIWTPVIVAANAAPVDVLWVVGGKVEAVATLYGGIMQALADHVIEVPAGWSARHGIRIGMPAALFGTEEHAGN